MNIFIIIPAFGESLAIFDVLTNLSALGYRIVVVDDGSKDGTFEIANSFPVIAVRHAINLGQGAALETGMEVARRLDADYIVHFDADGQHDPLDIEQLLKPLLAGETDIVFGSRFLEAKAVGLRIEKKILLKAARWLNYCFTGILLSDAHNGLRAMNKKALHAVKLNQAGMAHASEILGIVRKKLLRYKEIPVHIRYTDYSKQKGQGISNAINIVFHLLFKRN